MPEFVRRTPCPQVKGGYAAYREYVREDFRRRCAHCVMEELHAGGVRNFEIDHFRPRGRFPECINDFYNLYWSCHPCNQNKRDEWPSPALEEQGIGFVDLCSDDFDKHYEDEEGKLKPLTRSGAYTVDVIRLNSEHLVDLRRLLTQWYGSYR